MTDNKVKNRAEYLPLAKAFAKDAVHDKGCHGMEVYIDQEQKDRVVFISEWETKEDFLAHVQGPAFAKHIPGMGAYYISGKDIFLELA